MEQKQGGNQRDEEECGESEEEKEQNGEQRVEEEDCGDERMQQEQQQLGGVLGRRTGRCSYRRGWRSRCRASAGWSWECCGEEDVEVIWELRKGRSFGLAEQTSCWAEEELCGWR